MMQLLPSLESAIRALRATNPLLPVQVVVPSHLLGAWLTPRLFADTGHLGIDFLLLPELAWKGAASRLLAEGRTRVPENVDLALLLAEAREATEAEGTPEYLKDAARMAGFGPAALRTLQDLGAAGVQPEALEAQAPRSADPERLRLLARMARGLRVRLGESGLVDRASLYREAAKALPCSGLGAVVLVRLDDVPPVGAEFLEALKRHHPVAIVKETRPPGVAPRHDARKKALVECLGLSTKQADKGSQATTSALARLQQSLFDRARRDTPATTHTGDATEPKAQPALDDTVHVLAAAGESLEAVEIARLIQRATAQGFTHADVAVLLHDTGAYAAHLASAFSRAGIDAYFVEGEPRVDPAARGLWLLLGLVGGDLDRRAVMELFTTARIRWESLLGQDAAISPSRWDRLSAEAGIVSGREAWRTKLEEARKAREARGYQNDRELRLYDSLLKAVDRLADDLAAFPEEGGWDEYLAHTLRLLGDWIDRGRLTRERLERVLGPLAEHAPPPTREEFLARVRDLLATQVYREGSLADGRVLVSSIAAARGMSFKLVIVPGLVERRFPSPPRPDPLLLDDEREALSPALRTTRDAVEEERLLFLDATRAAEERLVLSYPRFETATGRERVPSSFLLEAVEAAVGQRVGARDLARLADPGATGLGRPHPEEPHDAVDLVERDLALVASGTPGAARHLLEDAPTVRRALEAEAAAWDTRLTPYDGLITATPDEEAYQKLLLAGRRSSATAVEAFAACPYKHLLSRGFSLRAWEDPEHAYQLAPKDWGQLYHRATRELFAWLRERGWLPLEAARIPEAETRLLAILEEQGKRLVAEGSIVSESLLEPAKGWARSEIVELLEREARDESGFVPTDYERDYGDLGVELAPGRTVTFGGTLDRIDVSDTEKAVRVIDYKTGRYKWKDGEQFRGGRELQLAIYNRAAQSLYPDHEIREALYYHAVAREKFKQKTCPATAEVGETLERVLRTLDDTARAGAFAPVADTCEFCNFQGLCGTQREARAERKRSDSRLAEFMALREIP
jgi:ATP-dependent helicase/nuclease subunit B